MKSTLLLSLLSVTVLAEVAHAQTAMIPASQDNSLYESVSGALSNGAGNRAFFGATLSGLARRYLVQFDVAGALPAGAVVTNVTLQINVEGQSPAAPPNPTQDLHRMTQAWGEGTSDAGYPGGMGAPSTPGDATWIHSFFSGSNWTSAGGDFVSTPSGTFSINGFGLKNLSDTGMIADVQDMLNNPAGNFGWVLKDRGESPGTAKVMTSREGASNQPMLIVDYTMGGPGLTPFCDPADLNSTGFPTVLMGTLGGGVGSGLHLESTQGPPGQFGYFLVGTAITDPGIPIGAGHLCVGGMTGRYNVTGTFFNSTGFFDASGVLQNTVGTSTTGTGFDVPSVVPMSGSPMITSGSTWNFQLWHRENGGSSNFSNGVSATF